MRAEWAWALIALGACSGKGGCAHGGGESLPAGFTEACDAWAARYCARLATCAPTSVEVDYGDVGRCISRNRPACASALVAPGNGRTPESLLRCARSYDAASCDDVVVGRPPEACRVPGHLPAGAACGDDAQCAGAASHCRLAGDEVCGTCAPLGEAGSDCDSDRDCASGLVCYFTCMPPVALGEACDGMTRQCPQTLVCFDYVCSASASLGAPCEPRADRCDHDHEMFCDPIARACVHYVAVDPGSACGAGTVCRGGSCSPEGTGDKSTCVANAKDGAPCDASLGPSCTAPARCVAGFCKMPDAAKCI